MTVLCTSGVSDHPLGVIQREQAHPLDIKQQPPQEVSRMQFSTNDVEPATDRGGSHDGLTAGDNDQPYRFGLRPRTSATFPFSTKQYLRLLVLRSRVHAGLIAGDGWLAPIGA
jgi:hypothetical protein